MRSTGVLILLVCQLAGNVVAGSSLQSRETVINKNGEDGPKLVCYYTPTRYFPASKVPSDVCTHLIYAFGSLNEASLDITTPTSGIKAIWQTLTSLRHKNPQLKVMLSLQQGFPSVVGADVQRMQKFAANSVAFLRQYGFDGVDMDWEYPSSSQKDAFAKFFTLMRAAIDADAKKTGKAALLLSLAMPNNQYVVARSFDIPTIARAVDFATAMTYDFHVYSKGDSRTGYNSPITAPTGESPYLSASGMANYYLQQARFPASKLLLGIPTYGRSWKLASPASHSLHAPALGKGAPGPYRHITGVYTYPDTCMAIKEGAKKVSDSQAGAVYLYHDTTWVAYDNVETVRAKCQWARSHGLGGVGVWAMHLDDISEVCGQGTLPLLNTMKTSLLEQNPIHPFHFTITKDDDLKEPRPKLHLQPSPTRMPADAGTKEPESIVYREVHQDLYAVILRSEQSAAAASSRFQLRPRGSGLTLERSGSEDAVIFMENVDVLLEKSAA